MLTIYKSVHFITPIKLRLSNYLKVIINYIFDEFTPYFCADINDVIITFLTFGKETTSRKNKYATDIYFMVTSHFSRKQI